MDADDLGWRSMPVEYARDDERRRIKITARDPLSVGDVIAYIDRQVTDHAWAYSVLYDARGMRSPPAASEIPKIVAYIGELVAQHGPRGPVAIVTRVSATVGVGQIYAVLGEKTGLQVEVFWDIDEAERWLDSREREGKNKA